MTITIEEVIAQCAKACEQFEGPHRYVDDIAAAIRALAAQYEGCIVAETPSFAYTIVDQRSKAEHPEMYIAHDGTVPEFIPRYKTTPLYRAREPTP